MTGLVSLYFVFDFVYDLYQQNVTHFIKKE